ncbi:DNA mismatch repair protein MutL [Actinoplanes lobatus]|uniref:Cytoskeletal protein RodZ n=1 Tax=Actinoplanes lobatus TaxID=113568 RepID=A0A7W7MEV8_9ACTN|nr:DNA mismatch repair protein MutL [Actinoplanes lobatus]MBB4747646.1 cytoskeletal protein RodZ [Actinoplanes lobatus]
MRSSRWVPIAGWCLATATSIVLGSVALSPVLTAARADNGALPDIDQLPAPAAVSETSDAPPPAETTAPARTTRPTTSAKPGRTRPSSARPTGATTTPAATTKPATTTEDGWTVTTSDGVKTYVRSFTTEGGTAVVKMTSEGIVSLVTATPADGYRVEKTGSDVNLAVYFNETNHSFIIHAQWFNGAPFVEVSEVGE